MTTSTLAILNEIGSLNEVFVMTKNHRRARGPAHVLVVEDDVLTRRIVTHTLKQDYAMISASNAREGVAEYVLHAPDIVFLDIGLPDVDGFCLLEEIMLIDPDAFVVMFSAGDYPENVVKALDAGARGFISKPFKKETLSQFIQASERHHGKTAKA